MEIFGREVDIMSVRDDPRPLLKDGRFAIFLERYWPVDFDEPYSLNVYKDNRSKSNTFCWLSKDDLLWLRKRIDELLEDV